MKKALEQRLSTVQQCKHDDKLDHYAILHYADKGVTLDGILNLLQVNCSKGDTDYIKHLQKLLEAKTTIDLALEIQGYARIWKSKPRTF